MNEGRWADVFLWRSGRVRGYAVAIWKHQQVATVGAAAELGP